MDTKIAEDKVKELEEYLEQGFEIYKTYVLMSSDKLAINMLGMVEEYISGMGEMEKLQFEAELIGKFLIGLSGMEELQTEE